MSSQSDGESRRDAYLDVLLLRASNGSEEFAIEVFDRIERLLGLNTNAHRPFEDVGLERRGRAVDGAASPSVADAPRGPAISRPAPGGKKRGTQGYTLVRRVSEAVDQIDHEPFTPLEIATLIGVRNVGPVQHALDRITGRKIVPHANGGVLSYTRVASA